MCTRIIALACMQLWRDACMAACPTQQRDRFRVHRREQTGRQHRSGSRHKYSATFHRDSPRIASPSEHRTIIAKRRCGVGEPNSSSPGADVARVARSSVETGATGSSPQPSMPYSGQCVFKSGAEREGLQPGCRGFLPRLVNYCRVRRPARTSTTLPGKREPVL